MSVQQSTAKGTTANELIDTGVRILKHAGLTGIPR